MFGLNLFPAIHIEIFLTQPQKSYGWNLAAWIFNGIIGQNTVSFSEIMREGTMTFLAMMLLPGAYLVIAALLFIAAMTSYALTGKASSFFNIAGNVRLIVRYLGDFLLLCFFILYVSDLPARGVTGCRVDGDMPWSRAVAVAGPSAVAAGDFLDLRIPCRTTGTESA